ncbi:DUF4236 domain-containing protein [Edwardsiella tarda]|uniref:DUF4236 domain-containing protein n=1 Tax=Edwardsiella tarda TaxID=636 RepID=UPI0008FAD918|nr:DUF4236 domain-containing protein [Edwardsiella tarda]
MAHIRFQRRIKLLPFLWLNLAKTGASITIGLPFVKVNIGRRGIWLSSSLPGTGISARHQLRRNKKPRTKRGFNNVN